MRGNTVYRLLLASRQARDTSEESQDVQSNLPGLEVASQSFTSYLDLESSAQSTPTSTDTLKLRGSIASHAIINHFLTPGGSYTIFNLQAPTAHTGPPKWCKELIGITHEFLLLPQTKRFWLVSKDLRGEMQPSPFGCLPSDDAVSMHVVPRFIEATSAD
jgi:hypothetical protein